jgi:hypothetical protein
MDHSPKLLLLIFPLLLLFLSAQGFGQQIPAASDALQSAKFTITVGPYKGKGSEEMPVQFASLKGLMGSNGVLDLDDIRLVNHSEKTVRELEMVLFLYNERDPETVVATAHFPQSFKFPYTPFKKGIGLPHGRIMGIGFTKQLGLLEPIREGSLEGAYRIEVAVCSVEFEDGSSWTLGSMREKGAQ